MHTDAQRHQLYEELAEVLSPPSRDVLMDLLPPVGWSDVARQSDTALLHGDMAELRGEMSELRGELKGEMSQLRVELKSEMADFRVELKGELSELRSHVDAQLPKLIAANIASMIGVAGLVLVAAQLA